jgi:hypothetical protein
MVAVCYRVGIEVVVIGLKSVLAEDAQGFSDNPGFASSRVKLKMSRE